MSVSTNHVPVTLSVTCDRCKRTEVSVTESNLNERVKGWKRMVVHDAADAIAFDQDWAGELNGSPRDLCGHCCVALGFTVGP